MTIFREEIFGQVAAASTFEEEAIALANKSEYGLGSAVFSMIVERVHRVADRLEAVWFVSTAARMLRSGFRLAE